MKILKPCLFVKKKFCNSTNINFKISDKHRNHPTNFFQGGPWPPLAPPATAPLELRNGKTRYPSDMYSPKTRMLFKGKPRKPKEIFAEPTTCLTPKPPSVNIKDMKFLKFLYYLIITNYCPQAKSSHFPINFSYEILAYSWEAIILLADRNVTIFKTTQSKNSNHCIFDDLTSLDDIM